MFLEALKKQNSELIQSAVLLLRQGEILPDTYVIDVDRFRENAKKIKQKADELDIKLFAMTKQIGRNPVLASILIDECGYEGAVCVDFKEALSLHKNRIKISHVGHLVQPPKHILTRLISEVKPEIITVYSIEKAREISQVAVECGVVQGIMLKFYQDGDHLYPNQESGFHLSALDEVVERITALPNLNVTGITHFPCFLYDQDAQKTRPTANLTTAKQAIERLAQKGISITHRNYPSATSCETIAMIRQHGGTHGEPGHALTGTTPANVDASQPESVAMVYVTEVSHVHQGKAYCFGGGNYGRSHVEGALVFNSEASTGDFLPVCPNDSASIDYYFQLAGKADISAPVIMAFRTQLFVTRSDVALVEGISTSAPKVVGLFDTQGRQIER
ncbi:YhfX family PLP-dependent enzyme [Enterovibrio nigricans]|uniref:Predicted amino acid racemase n=1 Tax=Enterovibrio nigricans DSM 22720 TaxID=1121868 RepID=A0A1T4VSQ0_9GAMM|nr:YhfX family PLP-dependent enzyme [Enterovibrio nigricans]SKA68034.1 Predicted amino acid racemase [Enterovibrio nigricans DSM 22720]